MDRPARSYGAVAWCYDELAALYSLGRIGRAKAHHLRHLRAGDRVLYAGVGRGAEAVRAVERGAVVTAVDLAPAMLRRFERALGPRAEGVARIEGDLFQHRHPDGYDVVVAPFVLNVFDRPTMRRALTHLAALVRPGGRICIADFAPPPVAGPAAWLCRAYYAPVAVAARVVGLAALHPIYDYAPVLARLGFRDLEREGFALLGRGPAVYEALTARKPG